MEWSLTRKRYIYIAHGKEAIMKVNWRDVLVGIAAMLAGAILAILLGKAIMWWFAGH